MANSAQLEGTHWGSDRLGRRILRRQQGKLPLQALQFVQQVVVLLVAEQQAARRGLIACLVVVTQVAPVNPDNCQE